MNLPLTPFPLLFAWHSLVARRWLSAPMESTTGTCVLPIHVFLSFPPCSASSLCRLLRVEQLVKTTSLSMADAKGADPTNKVDHGLLEGIRQEKGRKPRLHVDKPQHFCCPMLHYYYPLIFAHTSRPTPIKHFSATHSAFNFFWV